MSRAALEEFYRGRQVLVTGHTGFKGAWLALALAELGATVTGVALEPAAGGMYELAHVGDRVDHRHLDIRDVAALTSLLEDVQPEVVFHLAAQALVPESFRDPVGTFDVNVVGTAAVLAACGAVPSVRAVVAVTSDKVYANDASGRPFIEDDRFGGGDPYSASKGAAELVIASWRHSFLGHAGAFTLGSARAGNVVGGGDRARDRVIPDLIDALGRGTAVRLRNPAAIRPWQFVLEPVVGYLDYGRALVLGSGPGDGPAVPAAVNFGPDPTNACTVEELVDLVIEEWGTGAWTPTEDRPGPEAFLLLLDSSLAERTLGWRSRLDVRELVRLTVDWYRCAADRGDCAGLSIQQLDAYLSRLD